MRYHEIVADVLYESARPPKPRNDNLLDAIQHADDYDAGWTLDDFTLRYEGELPVDDLYEFDDISGWLDAHDADDLVDFRDGAWNSKPKQVPPIIVITAPEEGHCHTQIGDGRGRVNFANVHGLKLHVWHLIHKECG